MSYYFRCATAGAGQTGLGDVARIRNKALEQLPSASLSLGHLVEVLRWVEGEVVAGAAGIVLTQGTDSLEESASFLDLLWTRSEPLVITGAIRTPSHLPPDQQPDRQRCTGESGNGNYYRGRRLCT